ncbi:MAG: ATP-dependent DNA helicase RecG [Phycisphaerales bacterium]|nr:ATP-dependent DNA helicase RecG [Phycisphaerales bacterium]
MAEEPIQLTTPIHAVPTVTPQRVALFHRLGIRSVAHLLYHIPTRYEYRQEESDIDGISPGELAAVRGIVDATRIVKFGQPRFQAVLQDETGAIELIWFNSLYLANRIHPGMSLRVQGKVAIYRSTLQIVNPKWEVIDPDSPVDRLASRLRPIYAATEDLPSQAIEAAVDAVLDDALPLIDDHFTDDFRRKRELPQLANCYRTLHDPDVSQGREAAEIAISDARRRLAYDELLLLQLGVSMKRHHLRQTLVALALTHNDAIADHIRARFPFTLTAYQQASVDEIVSDMTTAVPMNRLLQGDVGSGKTAVALYAMLLAVADRHQAVMMAPTELLAEQHHAVITHMLRGSNVRIGLLTGSLPTPQRRLLVQQCRSGEIDIVIGTHALLTGDVQFRSLALAVTDEQHRFGVEQRAQFRVKAHDRANPTVPHILVMTATPIPRTLSLTLFGDLDISIISGLPPGRVPITTKLVDSSKHDEIYTYASKRIEQGDQVYVVLPAIDDSPTSSLKAVRSHRKLLEETHFKGVRIAAVHGQLKRATRERIMDRFRAGEIRAIIATTVIEVGVDVPNATMMIVEHAERFGLAQLHQLRGRIGRGSKNSVCILVADPTTEDAGARLEAIVSTMDGFVIAEQDLLIRGMGEIVGTRQSGLPDFRVARLPDDLKLLQLARRDAQEWIERSPRLASPDETLLRKRLLKTHGESLGLADVG